MKRFIHRLIAHSCVSVNVLEQLDVDLKLFERHQKELGNVVGS